MCVLRWQIVFPLLKLLFDVNIAFGNSLYLQVNIGKIVRNYWFYKITGICSFKPIIYARNTGNSLSGKYSLRRKYGEYFVRKTLY